MTVFLWLVLGHLVGDWVLQNDWMAKGKTLGLVNRAGLTHFAIYATTILTTLWLSGWRNRPVLTLLPIGLGVFATHWLIDAGRLAERWMHLYRQSNVEVVRPSGGPSPNRRPTRTPNYCSCSGVSCP